MTRWSEVLWDIASGCAICGSPTDGNLNRTVKFLNCDSATVITAGHYNLCVWDYDAPNNKLRPTVVKLGQLRRIFECLHVDADDTYAYVGTSSGDVLKIDIEKRLLRGSGPKKSAISGGVTSVLSVGRERIFVGGGDGSVRLLSVGNATHGGDVVREKCSVELSAQNSGHCAPITGIVAESEDAEGTTLLVATESCDIQRLEYCKARNSFSRELLQTSHAGPINAIVFPSDYGAIFATCGVDNIRVWHLQSCRELLRVVVPNLECHCIAFSHDGSLILSGWSDGAIRAFRPQSGKLVFKRPDAHHRPIRSLASTKDARRLVTGGEEGTIRVWTLVDGRCDLVASMKEHKSAVTSICINLAVDDEFASCSEDGSCVIWNLNTFHRRNSFSANTCFKAIAYHPDGSQIVSAGTDRQIAYWDPFDGQTIRTMDGSKADPVFAVCTDPIGETIVSGGGDAMVRLWSYDAGCSYARGEGHGGSINALGVSPDGKSIVSVGSEGGIFVWNYIPPPDASVGGVM